MKPVTLAVLSMRALIIIELLLDFAFLDEKQREDVKVFQESKNWALAFTE